MRLRILGIVLRAVKASHNCLANAGRFDRIFRVHQAFGQRGKLRATQLSLGIKLIDKAHDARLLFGGEAFDFVNDLRCGHRKRIRCDLERIKACGWWLSHAVGRAYDDAGNPRRHRPTSTVRDRRYSGYTCGNRDLPAERRRRTRIIRTIHGFALIAAVSVAVPVMTMLVIVGLGIIGAGADNERAAEKERDEFPFTEAPGVRAALDPAD